MLAAILEIISTALQFGFAIFQAAMDDKSKSDALNQAFIIDQAKKKSWADAALQKLGLDAKQSTAEASNAWDKQDMDKKS